MNPPDARSAGDAAPPTGELDPPPTGELGPRRTARAGRPPAPEQRPVPPAESVPEQPSAGPEPAGGLPVEPSGGPPADGLTDRERQILAFERQWWKHAGAKEQAIRDTFGLSATRYYQLLNNLLDKPAALAVEPQIVARLRRLRAARARNRRR